MKTLLGMAIGMFLEGLVVVALMIGCYGVAHADYRETTLAPAGTVVTATGSTATVDRRLYDIRYDSPQTVLLVDVTAASGTTPSVTFSLQGVINGIAFTLGSCTAITAVSQCVLQVAAAPTNVRLSYVISGTTPSFTYSAYVVTQ